VDTKADLNDIMKCNFLTPARLELEPLIRPGRNIYETLLNVA
jgi:hypothetical protein